MTPLAGAGARGARGEHSLEDLYRLPHFVQGSQRDAAVSVFERGEIPSDRYLECGAGVTELFGRSLQVDEDAVGMRVWSLESETLERAEREVAHAGVFGALLLDVLRVPERRDTRCC